MATVSKTINGLTVPSDPQAFANIGYWSNVDYYFEYNHGITTYTDYTTEANEDTANDAPLLPSAPIQAQDAHFVGHGGRYFAILYEVGTAGAGTYNGDFRYWNGSGWFLLPTFFGGEVDLDDFKVQQKSCLFLLPPSDWERNSVNGTTAYWIRYADVVPGAGYSQPLANRIRVFPAFPRGGQMHVQII